MESATASVVIIVGALAEGGVKPTPIQPPKPIAVIIDGTIRSKTANVAYIDLTNKYVTSNITKYIVEGD